MKRLNAWLISSLVIMGLLALTWAAPTQAGRRGSGPSAAGQTDLNPVAVVGEIKYVEYLNGYVVQADEPDGSWGQYLIMNRDDEVLEALADSDSFVYVEGTLLPGSSFILKVSKIDGRNYGSGANAGTGRSAGPRRR